MDDNDFNPAEMLEVDDDNETLTPATPTQGRTAAPAAATAAHPATAARDHTTQDVHLPAEAVADAGDVAGEVAGEAPEGSPDTATPRAAEPASAAHSPTPSPAVSPAVSPADGAGGGADSVSSGGEQPIGASDREDRSAAEPSRYIYLRRQLVAVGCLAVFALGAWWVNGHGFPGAAPSPAEQALGAPEHEDNKRNATRVPGMAQARTDQDTALRWYRNHGSYDEFTLTGEGARVAGHGDVLVASRLTEGVCLMYAMQQDERTEVTIEPTGVACTDAEMAATATELRAQAEQNTLTNTANATAAFTRLSEVARLFAAGAFRDGQPSLDGLPATGLVEGISIDRNHGSHVEATYRDQNTCARAVIAADGTIGEQSPCR